MKRIIVPTAIIAILTGLGIGLSRTSAQGQAGASKSAPHMVGLVDMAYIFKNYKKFTAMREGLKAEIQNTDQKAKSMAENVRGLQSQIREFKEGSTEFLKIERQLASAVTEFKTFEQLAKRDFMRKESQIYKTVYLEAIDAIKLYVKHYPYTLIIRFNREGIESVDNPQQVLSGLNKQVVYHRKQDDITDSILDYLNNKYKPGVARGGGGAANRRPNPR